MRHWTRAQVLRDYRFYVLLPVVMAPAFITTGIFFHQILLVESKGWSVDLWAASFVAFAALLRASSAAFSLASGDPKDCGASSDPQPAKRLAARPSKARRACGRRILILLGDIR